MFRIKRGDTLAFAITIKDDVSGEPINIPVDRFKCEIRDRIDILYSEVEIIETATPGVYLLIAGTTETWPLGTYYLDIEHNLDGRVSSSSTAMINIEKDVTYS